MARILDSVIKEMNNYSNMGLPSGETSMGMGDTANLGMRGANTNTKIKAYKLSDLLQQHNRAEEEEVPNMDMADASLDNESSSEENPLKQFFINNPSPTDDAILQYAEENNLDLSEMRVAIYSLIQDLLKGSSDDFDEMGDTDIDDREINFDVRGDTGERPATNELGSNPRF